MQNDYVFTFDLSNFKTVSTAGYAFDGNTHVTHVYNYINPPSQNFANIQLNTAPLVYGPITSDIRAFNSAQQFYLAEQITTPDNRIILNAGVSNYNYSADSVNRAVTGVNGAYYKINGDKTTVSYGAVIKPVKDISLFYGYSETAVPIANVQSVFTSSAPQLSEGKQHEGGIKFRLLDQMLFGSITCYRILQTAFSVPNPANLTVPPPATLQPNLYSNRKAFGFEYQLTAALTPGLSLIAAYTNFTNRDPNNVPFRGTAEQSGSAYIRYEFEKGAFRGFSAGLGASYMARRPGDAASGVTAASTATNIIPNQPSFYLPSQTLVSLNLSYAWRKIVVRVNIDNLLDKEYIAAPISRYWNMPGAPRYVYGSITYKL